MSFKGEKIFETQYWNVYLAENQTYVGYCIVLLKRECGDLAELNNDEILDFLKLVKTYEQTLRKAFGATMFNWSCLMNLAYQNTPPDPQVHWHVKPRYSHPVTIGGQTFEDRAFGKHYEVSPECELAPGVREVIVAELKKVQHS